MNGTRRGTISCRFTCLREREPSVCRKTNRSGNSTGRTRYPAIFWKMFDADDYMWEHPFAMHRVTTHVRKSRACARGGASTLGVTRMEHRSAQDYGTAVRVTECLKFSERGQIERNREDDARSNNRRRSHRLCTQPLESVLTNSRRRRPGRDMEGKKCWRAFFFPLGCKIGEPTRATRWEDRSIEIYIGISVLQLKAF